MTKITPKEFVEKFKDNSYEAITLLNDMDSTARMDLLIAKLPNRDSVFVDCFLKNPQAASAILNSMGFMARMDLLIANSAFFDCFSKKPQAASTLLNGMDFWSKISLLSAPLTWTITGKENLLVKCFLLNSEEAMTLLNGMNSWGTTLLLYFSSMDGNTLFTNYFLKDPQKAVALLVDNIDYPERVTFFSSILPSGETVFDKYFSINTIGALQAFNDLYYYQYKTRMLKSVSDDVQKVLKKCLMVNEDECIASAFGTEVIIDGGIIGLNSNYNPFTSYTD
jgi:hypothetical protein